MKNTRSALLTITLLFLFMKLCLAEKPSRESASLSAMDAEIAADKFPRITGVLISRDNRLLYEHYFGEGSREKLNDTRSVTKSLTALVVGRALSEGHLSDTNVKIMPFFKDLAPIANAHPAKDDIRLKDILSMGSALDADDSVQDSPGNEDRMHEQTFWTRWAVDLPVRKETKRDANDYAPFHYATVNAVLAGQTLERATRKPADAYLAETLLKPLGIEHYEFQRSPKGEVMTGGGLKLRGLDLLKIGQLVLDQGSFAGRQIIPALWIKECLTVRHADTVGPGIGYGYLFWHMDFPFGDKTESGWFMAGNGGNIVVIFPDLKGIAVVTRTDYNGRGTAGETIRLVSQFILPALRDDSSLP